MELFSSWTGSDFLLFYSVMLVFASALAWRLPTILREAGRRGGAHDLESVAVLAGGRRRLADSLLADLYVRGALVEADKGKLRIAARDCPVTPAAQALLATDAPLTLAEARRTVAVHAERVAARLCRAGLLLRPEEHTRLRLIAILPFVMLFLLGLYRQRAGSALGEPTGFLIALLVLTVVLAVMRYATCDPRTAAGAAAVRELKQRNDRFTRAPRPDEAAMAVALFGTGVLVGTPWEPVHALRQREGDSGGDGGSDGGSGCGGGCGGCGG